MHHIERRGDSEMRVPLASTLQEVTVLAARASPERLPVGNTLSASWPGASQAADLFLVVCLITTSIALMTPMARNTFDDPLMKQAASYLLLFIRPHAAIA